MKHQAWHQEVIPDSQSLQYNHTGGAGSKQREYDLPEDTDPRTAVNGCRFLDLLRDALDEAGKQQHTHAYGSGDVDQDRRRQGAI
ncbi:hypothetical protein D3C87_2100600 [compost metagenome]